MLIIDGVDGLTDHVRLPDLNASGDAALGSVVELRRFEDASGRQRVALAVRSDLPLETQVPPKEQLGLIANLSGASLQRLARADSAGRCGRRWMHGYSISLTRV